MKKTVMVMPANCVALKDEEAKKVYGGYNIDYINQIGNYAYSHGCFLAGKYAHNFYKYYIPEEDLHYIKLRLMDYGVDAFNDFMYGYDSTHVV